MTLVELVEAYLAARCLAREGRHAAMLQSMARRLVARGHGMPDADQLARWLQDLRMQGASAATCLCYRRMLLALYRWGHARGMTPPLGGDDLPAERGPRRIPEAWTVEEVRRLVAAAAAQPGACRWCGVPRAIYWSTLLLAGWYTAARIGSLLTVRWRDVDLVRGWLRIPAEAEKTRCERLFALPASYCRVMGQLPRRFPQVWPAPRQRRHLYQGLRALCEVAEIPCPPGRWQCFHRLRRSAISAVASIDLEAARRLAGHASAQLTLRHYVDPRIAFRPQIPVPEIDPPPRLRVIG